MHIGPPGSPCASRIDVRRRGDPRMRAVIETNRDKIDEEAKAWRNFGGCKAMAEVSYRFPTSQLEKGVALAQNFRLSRQCLTSFMTGPAGADTGPIRIQLAVVVTVARRPDPGRSGSRHGGDARIVRPECVDSRVRWLL